MSEIFISYSKHDRRHAESLAYWLEQHSYDVFWDRKLLAGQVWPKEIEKALGDAKAVIVMWSETSIDSNWVKNEANDAAEREILIPVMIDDSKMPLPFRHLQTIDLIDWNKDRGSRESKNLLESISKLINRKTPLEREREVLIVKFNEAKELFLSMLELTLEDENDPRRQEYFHSFSSTHRELWGLSCDIRNILYSSYYREYGELNEAIRKFLMGANDSRFPYEREYKVYNNQLDTSLAGKIKSFFNVKILGRKEFEFDYKSFKAAIHKLVDRIDSLE